MAHLRRRAVAALFLGAGLPALAAPRLARGQTARTLRIVVPYPPGGGADLLARALGAHLQARGGRAVVVENRPGATGTIGAAAVARARPDGETLLQGDSAPMSIQPLANRLPYGPDDFAPVARLVTSPVILAAAPRTALRSIADVVAAARARPGGLSYATSGVLSHFHVAVERFAQLAGIEMLHVPFQGTAPAVLAAVAGQVDLIAAPPASLQEGSGGAQLRALASMTGAAVPEMPGLPTFREAGLDLVFEGWRGLFAPRGTPAATLAGLEREVLDAFSDPEFVQQVRRIGETPAPLGPDAFAAFWREDRGVTEGLLPRLPRN